jgi:hypothetical protein
MNNQNWLLVIGVIVLLCLSSSFTGGVTANNGTYAAYGQYGQPYEQSYGQSTQQYNQFGASDSLVGSARGNQLGGQYYPYYWWNPFSWGNWRTRPLDLSYYPSYDSGYIDGNSRGWYNDWGWYGQTRPSYYGRGRYW